jgi:hypothetical protein
MKRALLATLGFVLSLGFAACSGGSGLPATPTQGDDGGGSMLDVSVGGANLTASANPQDFGTLVVGQQGQPVRIVVTNTGTGASGALSTTVGGKDAMAFVVDTDACKGQTLAPQANCTITMHFAPPTAGALAADLTESDSGGDSVKVNLTGSATKPAEITLLPAMQDFGTVVDSASSTATTFTLANTGASDAGNVQLKIDGMDAEQFSPSMDGCSGKPLKAGSRCSILVAFAPSTSGSKTATLTATISGSPTLTSGLSGIGAGAAVFSVTPNPYDFGPATIGATPAPMPMTFTLSNTGGVMSGVPKFSVTGANMGDFTVDSSGCAAALAPNGSCQFGATFTPSVSASESATVGISAAATMSTSLQLQGQGLSPAALKPTPTSHDFGSILQGGTSSEATFTITNTGSAKSGALTVSIGGTDRTQFAITSQTCAGSQLAGGATCTIAVHFSPDSSTSGPVQARLVFSATPGGTNTATLTGIVATQASLAIGPTAYGYGIVAQGVQTNATTFTVTNSGTQSSGSPTVTKGGANPDDFVVVADNCTGNPVPGSSGTCTVQVAFKPSTQAAESATITVAASPGGAVTANLTGTGATQALIQLTPSPWPFGDQVQMMPTGAKQFTVTNTGGVPSGQVVMSMAGANPADFKIVMNTCKNQMLAANGAACTLGVVFTPQMLGTRNGTLTAAATPGGKVTSALSGNGVSQGALTVAPSPGTFSTNVGVPQTIPFMVTNTGGAQTSTPMVSLMPPTGTDFQITNGCTGPVQPGPSNGCTIQVTFTPKTTAPQSATLAIAANPMGASVSLSGAGTTPTLGFKTPLPSFYAYPGTTATDKLTLINSGMGPTGTLSFSGLPGSGFSITSPCSKTFLTAGDTCVIGVQYAPPGNEAPGTTDHATLMVGDSYPMDTGSPSASLTGTAEAQTAYLVMTSSPTVPYFDGSSSVMFTVTNWGATASGSLMTPTYSATQTSPGDLTGNLALGAGCAGMTLMPTQSCSYSLTFTAPSSPDAGSEGGSEGGTVDAGTPAAPFSGSTGVSDGTNMPSDPFQGCTQTGACPH